MTQQPGGRPRTTEQRIDALTDVERGILIHTLAAQHPRVAKRMLDQIDGHRQRAAAREAMPPHPYTKHPIIADSVFCWFKSEDTSCMRSEDDQLHTAGGAE